MNSLQWIYDCATHVYIFFTKITNLNVNLATSPTTKAYPQIQVKVLSCLGSRLICKTCLPCLVKPMEILQLVVDLPIE